MASPVDRVPLEVGEVDLARRIVDTADGPVRLTTREGALLTYLVERSERAVAREELSREVFGQGDQVVSRAVDSAMSRLRAKVERDPSAPRHLITVHGLGYRFVALDRSASAGQPHDRENGERRPSSPESPRREAMATPRREAPTVARAPASGVVTLDLACATAWRGDERVPLTGTEVALLRQLLAPAGRIVERSALQRRVWGAGGSERALHNALHRLRTKLGEDVLQTVRSQGVRLRPHAVAIAGLPERAGPLIGRAELLDDVAHAIDTAGLVSLLGPGGVGKTRLASAYVRLGHHVDVAWVDASMVADGAGLCRQIAGALDVTVQQRDLAQALARALEARGRFLLVLDNVEEVTVPAGALVARWLRHAPSLRVLVTSREPLRIADERRLLVPPLPEDDAIALFDARVEGLASSADDRDAARTLVRSLDGLPLAIELAAARVAALGVAALLDRLEPRFEILGDPLQATVAWSWERLDADEQRAWAQLSIFRAPFDLAMAERVLDAGPTATVDLIQSLVEKSLLVAVHSRDGTRYSVLTSLAAFARAQLDDTQRVVAQRRYVAGLAELGSDASLARAAERQGRARIDVARAAYPDLLHAVALGGELGMPEETARCAIAALSSRRRVGPHEELARLGAQATVDGLSAGTRALLLASRARSEHVVGRTTEARALAEEALRTSDAPLQTLEAYWALGQLLLHEAPAEAVAMRERALTLARASGTPGVIADALDQLGIAAYYTGAVDDAEAHWDEALRLARRAGSRAIAISVQGNRAALLQSLGAHDAAEAAYEEAIAFLEEHGDPARGAYLGNLANLLAGRGRYDEAESLYLRAIELHRRSGDLHHTGFVHANLGYARLRRGDLPSARQALQIALSHLDPANLMGRGFALATLGELERRSGAYVRARRHLDDADACLGDGAHPIPRIIALCARSRLASDEGCAAEAESLLVQATELAARCGLEASAEARVQIDAAREALR